LLNDAGYCLQANRKTKEGDRHPDRDVQFGSWTPANTPAALSYRMPRWLPSTFKRAEFHGEWNYTISPNTHPPNRALISWRTLSLR
jgi:hypothetical protein